MLPDFGPHLLVVAIVALVVVGPKDLPILLRRIGQFVAKMRGMAAEFRASFDEMARQSELDELRREVEAMRQARYTPPLSATEGHDPQVQSVFDEIDRGLGGAQMQFSPPMSSEIAAHAPDTPLAPAPATVPEAAAAPAAKPKRKAPAKPKGETATKPKAAKAKAASPAAPAARRAPAAKTAKAPSKTARRKAAAPETAS